RVPDPNDGARANCLASGFDPAGEIGRIGVDRWYVLVTAASGPAGKADQFFSSGTVIANQRPAAVAAAAECRRAAARRDRLGRYQAEHSGPPLALDTLVAVRSGDYFKRRLLQALRIVLNLVRHAHQKIRARRHRLGVTPAET